MRIEWLKYSLRWDNTLTVKQETHIPKVTVVFTKKKNPKIKIKNVKKGL